MLRAAFPQQFSGPAAFTPDPRALRGDGPKRKPRSLVGRGQAVRHETLDLALGGSNPPAPAIPGRRERPRLSGGMTLARRRGARVAPAPRPRGARPGLSAPTRR